MKFTDIDEYVQHLIKHINQQSEEIQSHQEYFNCTVCGRSLRSELQQIQHHRRYHAHYSNVKETEDDKIVENPPKIMLQNIYDHSKTKIKYPPRSPFYNPWVPFWPTTYFTWRVMSKMFFLEICGLTVMMWSLLIKKSKNYTQLFIMDLLLRLLYNQKWNIISSEPKQTDIMLCFRLWELLINIMDTFDKNEIIKKTWLMLYLKFYLLFICMLCIWFIVLCTAYISYSFARYVWIVQKGYSTTVYTDLFRNMFSFFILFTSL